MKNMNLFARLAAYFSFSSGLVWLGSYIARLSATYQLFESNEIVLKKNFTGQVLSGSLNILAPTVLLTFISYLIFIVTFSLFLLTSKISLRQNGWLFIISVIVYFTLPFEIVLMLIDWDLIQIFSSSSTLDQAAVGLIVKRIESLQGFPLIIIICYLAIPYLLIFKPFDLKRKPNEN
ncbi:MAG TPA: hypothetical protein VI362_05170 [Ignavibacteriaceae bacterium]|nr:hypothetical protein [Ignavibacteriaceae bacterium]